MTDSAAVSPPISVAIIDDEALVRAGLRLILSATGELDVVAEAEDGSEALDLVRRHRPAVVLMDIRMPRLDGLAATKALLGLTEPPKVIMLTTFDVDEHVFAALESGASGFLLKDTPPRELIQAVKVVAAGAAMLSPTITHRLIGHFSARSPGPHDQNRQQFAQQQIATLTEREREVLVAVASGQSNAEIGRSLYLSEATVKAHVSRLLTKLAATNRVQVAILAYSAGLVK